AYAKGAAARGLQVIVAGAGGAAHLPGMAASMTRLPVLGVPVESRTLQGLDSLLSIAQMPAGVPVGTLAIGKAGATNAGLLVAAEVAAAFTQGAFDDEAALARFGAEIDVATYEFENIATGPLAALAELVPLHPPVAALQIAQDRLEEKIFVQRHGGRPAPFAP